MPDLGWLQIVGFVVFLELAYGTQDPKKEPGDVGGLSWIRYDDPETKKFKLNVRHDTHPSRRRQCAWRALCCGGRCAKDCSRPTAATPADASLPVAIFF